jgi:hypothetical protein
VHHAHDDAGLAALDCRVCPEDGVRVVVSALEETLEGGAFGAG